MRSPAVSLKKQMSYANAKSIPYVSIAGENEIAQGKITLKNMVTGEQQLISPDEMVATIMKDWKIKKSVLICANLWTKNSDHIWFL